MGSRLGICIDENSYSDKEKGRLMKLEERFGKWIVIINTVYIYDNHAFY